MKIKNVLLLCLLSILVSCDNRDTNSNSCVPSITIDGYPCSSILNNTTMSRVVYDNLPTADNYDQISFRVTIDTDSVYHFHMTDWYDFTQGVSTDSITYSFVQTGDTMSFSLKKSSYDAIYEKKYATTTHCMKY